MASYDEGLNPLAAQMLKDQSEQFDSMTSKLDTLLADSDCDTYELPLAIDLLSVFTGQPVLVENGATGAHHWGVIVPSKLSGEQFAVHAEGELFLSSDLAHPGAFQHIAASG